MTEQSENLVVLAEDAPREQPPKKRRRILKRILIALGAIIVIACIAFCVYVSQYHHATSEATDAMQSGASVEVAKLPNGDIAFEAPDSQFGVILYPGAKVEYTSYAPLARAVAERGVTCVVVSMPFNLAFFGVGNASGIPKQLPEVEHWYLAGHSLGGAMASSYAKDASWLDGLILLAAYSTEDLSKSDLQVMSIYGTNDGVLNRDKYMENRENLPALTGELVIQGGNHAQFGTYGKQEGDGIASISGEEQIAITADAIAAFVKSDPKAKDD